MKSATRWALVSIPEKPKLRRLTRTGTCTIDQLQPRRRARLWQLQWRSVKVCGEAVSSPTSFNRRSRHAHASRVC